MSTPPSDHTPDSPLSFADVLQEECERLHPRPQDFRQHVKKIKTELSTALPSTQGSPDDPRTKDAVARHAVYKAMHDGLIRPSALCFSGGGIRSATFNLGLIQALAKLNLLDKFDYLSTVSGGGYIGAWLTAWIHRSRKSGGSGVSDVQEALKTDGSSHHASPTHAESYPVMWLREFSNYLTPKLGLFSADSWTMIGIALRNLLLNWLVLIPILTAVFMIPRLQVAVVSLSMSTTATSGLMLLGLVLTIPALIYLHYYRPGMAKYRVPPSEGASSMSQRGLDAQRWFIRLCLVPFILSVYCLTTAWAWYRNAPHGLSELRIGSLPASDTFALIGCLLHVIPWLIAMIRLWQLTAPTSKTAFLQWRTIELPFIALSGAIGGLLLWGALTEIPSEAVPLGQAYLHTPPEDLSQLLIHHYAEWYAAFAVPGFVGLFLLVATLFIGVTSRFTADQDHEFWGRTGSWFLNIGLVVTGISVIVIFGPGWVAKTSVWTWGSVGGAAGLMSLAGGFSAKTLLSQSDKQDRGSWLTEYGVRIGTPLFVIILIVGLTLGTSMVVKTWSAHWTPNTVNAWEQTGYSMPEPDPYAPSTHSLVLHNAPPSHLFALWALLISTGVAMGFFVNANKFSLHGFYRNRLIRAYLGASRGLKGKDERRPNALTGFDPKDNISMAELANYDFDIHAEPVTPSAQRPFHIVNIALNLVRGDKLAWQQRKAQSFTVSPLHCGSWQTVGYRRSCEYGYNASANRAISLGTAVATSGAAASPNMGYHSSSAVTFLLALFNIRLGWWIGNPGEAGNTPFLGKLGKMLKLWPTYTRSHPAFSIAPLVAELFGYTNANHRYVYLSDGGHFENLALYEMVLRRCHFIVVVDAGCDTEWTFQDLGNAIRKIRIDQGIEIDIDLGMLQNPAGSHLSQWHHAIGTIRYDKVDQGAPIGTLLYIKTSLTGDEPPDVNEYAKQHEAFPHEPTADQFFSESQFESYRRLGQHVGEEVLRVLEGTKDRDSSTVCSLLRSHWIPVPPAIKGSFLEHTERLIELERALRKDPDLARYDAELYPELHTIFGVSQDTLPKLDQRGALHLCNEQIQLMENVFLAVQLDQFHAHPLNRGWMNLFRRWTASNQFRAFWPTVRGTYSRPFVDFAETHLNLDVTILIVRGIPQHTIRATILREYGLEWPQQSNCLAQALDHPVFLDNDQTQPAVWLAGATDGQPPQDSWGIAVCWDNHDETLRLNVWVRLAYRNLGIGGKLLDQALIDLAKHHAGRQLLVDLGPDIPSLKGFQQQKASWLWFYEQAGFTRDRTVTTQLRMRKTL